MFNYIDTIHAVVFRDKWSLYMILWYIVMGVLHNN